MNPEPPPSWAFPYPPSNPQNYIKVCRLLAEAQDCPIEVFLSQDALLWLRTCKRGTKRPLRLKKDAYGSIINRLANRKWLIWLKQNQGNCKHIGDLLRQLQKKLSLTKSERVRVAESLVARRLIRLVASGTNDITAEGIRSLPTDKPRLPRPWGKPPGPKTPPHPKTKQYQWESFVLGVERFWRLDRRRIVSRKVSTIEEKEAAELQSEYELPYRLERSSKNFFRVSGDLPSEWIFEIDDEEMNVVLPRRQMRCFAAVSAMQYQLAHSHRELPMAIKILQTIATVLKNPHAGTLRDRAALAIIIMMGVPLQDLLEFGLGDNMTMAGAIGESGITLHAGSGFYPSLEDRIPPQHISLGMPPLFAPLLSEFLARNSDKNFLHECFDRNPLEQLLNYITYVSGNDLLKTQFLSRPNPMFLHRAFDYVAARLVEVPPGIEALILGRAVGPYRAASSYLSTTHVIAWLQKTQNKLLELALLPTFPLSAAIPSERVGVEAPTIADAVVSTSRKLKTVTNKNQATAARHLGFVFHGRRPTNDKPYPDVIGPSTEEYKLLIFADKNPGGGRRFRMVPAIKNLKLS